MNTSEQYLIFGVIVIAIIIGRTLKRGYFWTARNGEQLSFKDFTKRWKSGVVDITPLQQTTTTLWSFIPVVAGIVWGISVTFIGKIYWMSLILCGSLPITLIQVIGTYQRYKSQSIADKAFKEAMGEI